jgi:hypothetical protein
MRFRLLLIAVLSCTLLAAGGKLDRLHLDARHLRDTDNRVVILRGVVTITMNNDGKPMAMTPADYERIQAWGSNVQQIRLEACRLGLLPPCRPDPAYLDKLESWVAMGEEKGLYTIFKATTYDIPGLDFSKQFLPGAWDKMWDTTTGWQDQFIAGWKRVWERFKGRPTVIGYDILNECSPGSNTPGFIHNYLFPFYRKAYAALRQVDCEQFLLFQPALRSDDSLEPLGGENILFAPHFYTQMRNPDAYYGNLLKDDEKVEAPMLIGEYGLPSTSLKIGSFTVPAATPARDIADAALFDHTSMSIIKTWYTSVGNWALLNADGSEIPRFQYFSRPFPQRIAGVPKGFFFAFDTRQWHFECKPDPAIKAPTVIFVPLKRHYPNGFRAVVDSVELETSHESPRGLRVTANPKKTDVKAWRYDFATELLTIGAAKTVRIEPR